MDGIANKDANRTCYCADLHDDATAVANDMCDAPCPGSPHEVCGGALSACEMSSSRLAGMGVARPSSAAPRNGTGPRTSASASIPGLNPLLLPAAPPTMLLTIYGTIEDDVPPGAPGKGGRPPKAPAKEYEVIATSVVAAGTGGGRVVAIAVQTVVPIVTPAHNGSSANANAYTVAPVVGAGNVLGGGAAGFLRTLGYGLALWFVVLGIGMVL
ncbi:hypothetical protein F5B17DRAFT_18384 [Nemania serpens]|nr:hypothetical protein F5B17DRAFT_18384 [Nemania serpens]